MLEKFDVGGKDLPLMRNLYWDQKVVMKVNSVISEYIDLERSVRQDCVLSIDLFNSYGEMIFRSLEHIDGVKIGGYNCNNLRYADQRWDWFGSVQILKSMNRSHL